MGKNAVARLVLAVEQLHVAAPGSLRDRHDHVLHQLAGGQLLASHRGGRAAVARHLEGAPLQLRLVEALQEAQGDLRRRGAGPLRRDGRSQRTRAVSRLLPSRQSARSARKKRLVRTMNFALLQTDGFPRCGTAAELTLSKQRS